MLIFQIPIRLEYRFDYCLVIGWLPLLAGPMLVLPPPIAVLGPGADLFQLGHFGIQVGVLLLHLLNLLLPLPVWKPKNVALAREGNHSDQRIMIDAGVEW